VTSVAAMMLVEEGKLDLNAPIVTYAWSSRTVGGQPAKRQPQVVDLLRHRPLHPFRKAIRQVVGGSPLSGATSPDW
jgi:CubicO group peptidase (beta-lactamase class C family)